MNLPVMAPGLTRDLILAWSRRIDAGPFSSLAAGERITFPNPEIMVTLAAAAAVTERVRIEPHRAATGATGRPTTSRRVAGRQLDPVCGALG